MDENTFTAVQSASRESTIQVTGTVAQKRPPKVPEGEPTPPPEYEINVTEAEILSSAETPLPVGITDDVNVGLDIRLVMLLAKTNNIRDVIAFPKTTSAASLMDQSPNSVSKDQLEELNISILPKND